MPNAMSEIKRSEYGGDNVVIWNIDYLSASTGIPKAETIFLIIHDSFSFAKNAFPDNPGLSLFISLPIARNISLSEIQVLLKWSYLILERDEKSSFTILSSIHGTELTLSTLLKAQALLDLWKIFLNSPKFQELAFLCPEKVMIEFEENILQKNLEKAVEEVLSSNHFLYSHLIFPSGIKKQLVINLAISLFSNSLFNRSDVELNKTVSAIMRGQINSCKDAA